ncbi:DUF1488 domain-containing protein [Vibrio nigripulchritudo]|uniref:DUF1488 domain-containing protein n=1 Tax=Vibrio nigripulchritudo TaxID=28173 RepID=UPI0003B17F05|nr:DUF1488 domain-containing protein [Vibrio nigripulchritudo]CCN73824.1 conserved hypothetical protein [Vibrio nigripulchritudo SFn118]
MNQSILFPDMQTWDEENQVIRFPAQQSGMLIECLVSLEMIQEISKEEIKEEQQALSLFSQYRFEIEELAESLIEDEDYDSNGNIVVSR